MLSPPQTRHRDPTGPISLGIDVGSENVKLVTITLRAGRPHVLWRRVQPHHRQPQAVLRSLLGEIDLAALTHVAATGRLQRTVAGKSVPTKASLRRGLQVLRPDLERFTALSIGARGFSVLEVHDRGRDWYQQNARCAQGTGSFLAQLVRRFGLEVEQASALCDAVAVPSQLSARCPVILKTDMTHLANKGEDRASILAGLFDAIAENVLALMRPRLAPRDCLLVGGVARAPRIRRRIDAWMRERGLVLHEALADDVFAEAIGAAVYALDDDTVAVHHPDGLVAPMASSKLTRVPAFRDALPRVHRLTAAVAPPGEGSPRRAVMGLDIGSTGSKAALVDLETGDLLWDAYVQTQGAPVEAAQRLIRRWTAQALVRADLLGFGVTGSGREIVGSLLRCCYDHGSVFVMNEIAAHARGAVALDPEVDTIFEIGGQDAKYVRLEDGNVIDAAMNETCSAGTGSFIEEQGAQFPEVGGDVTGLAAMALEAHEGISLGQHCSVFMAELVDEAIAQGLPHGSIVAGLYDSVIQNYLNRVKGTRTVGRRIFCQGMPFSAPALAAAVARQTGCDVVVPPNPGTIGAFGIALLLRDDRRAPKPLSDHLDPSLFLDARVVQRETLRCPSTKGCGEPGNRCRIDRIVTRVGGKERRFLWGGSCSLYDRGLSRAKLPDRAPDPFREREQLVDDLLQSLRSRGPRVGLTDAFTLKPLVPLVATFLDELGFQCEVVREAGPQTLRAGIEGAPVPYCAPLQLAHGAYLDLARRRPDFVLFPRVTALPRAGDEEHSTLCPMAIAGPDLVAPLLPEDGAVFVAPSLEVGGDGYRGKALAASMRILAHELKACGDVERAFGRAVEAQERFDAELVRIGKRALRFCDDNGVVPVAVLGRPYTIYNDALSSNVPAILRGLGALAIPGECLPIPDETPVFAHQYWAQTQRTLRAAHHVRRTPGLYSVCCSNYGCGPDSFTLHFYAHVMKNKPFAVVETDGHSGDAGTRTRLEAFLYCVDVDRRAGRSHRAPCADFQQIDARRTTWARCRDAGTCVMVPRLGSVSEVAAAAVRAEGIRALPLPVSTPQDLHAGRRYTSGKECLPMTLTLGTLLRMTDQPEHAGQPLGVLMPASCGPCRFGAYHSLHKIALEQSGAAGRIEYLIPDEPDYFEGLSAGLSTKMWVGMVAHDLLQAMLLDARPRERRSGAASEAFQSFLAELIACMERPGKVSAAWAFVELLGGLWGVRSLMSRAAACFAGLRDHKRAIPAVALTGEIYVRLDPFSSDSLVERLEERGLRVRLAPATEWFEYSSHLAVQRVREGRRWSNDDPLRMRLQNAVQKSTIDALYSVCARELGWDQRVSAGRMLDAACRYLDPALTGEAHLTLGGPLEEFQRGAIDGVVIVGPHECMPCKISEAQYGVAAEALGVPYVSIPVNGEPIDADALDRFAFDVHRRARLRPAGRDARKQVLPSPRRVG